MKYEIRFDENLRYYAYAEDLDFSYRVYKKATLDGLQCYISKLLKVKHNISTEYRIPKQKELYMQIIHRLYLSKKLRGSIFSSICVIWAELGFMLYNILKGSNPIPQLKSIIFAVKYKKDIYKGNFHYELWYN